MQQSAQQSHGGAPASEAFWALVHKADKKFAKIRHIPFYHRNRQDYDAYFYKVFKVYTQLWKFQQENRQKLVDAGLRRSEIGEIASRIAQLYLGQYMRTSQASYLREAFVFYDALLTRDYFKLDAGDLSLATKQLRFVSRFLTVCLLLNRRDMLRRLLDQLRVLVDDCKKTFQETDFREWKLVVQELVRFLKADSSFMNFRPLRYSIVLDPDPETLASSAKRNLRLRDAVLSSYHHNEVKFTEITLDTFRMLQCLEWESSGSLYQPSVPKNSQNGNSSPAPNRTNFSLDVADPTLPPNPRKAVLYRPSVTHFLAVVATICEELPLDGVLLIYLSASGVGNHASDAEVDFGAASSLPFRFESESPDLSSSRHSKQVSSPLDAGCLQFGTHGNEGINCIYPSDLLPFTRRPLFLVIDGDNNHAFEAVNGAEKGETTAILLSQSAVYNFDNAGSHHQLSGSLFTAFLTAPLQTFCLLFDNSGSPVDMDKYYKAENLLSSSLKDWGSALVASDSLHPVWAQVLADPFLRRLILRFIFCRAVLAWYAPTFDKDEFTPRCVPSLPESFLPSATRCKTLVLQIANIFGIASSFAISPVNDESMLSS